MACYTGKASLTETDPNWKSSGKLTQELITCMKKHAQNFGVDWKWLAALANVESTWNIRAKNKYGFYGLFQYQQKYMNDKTKKVDSYDDQTYCAARDMKRRLKDAKDKYNMTGEEAYLYACIAHNTGDGGAQEILEHSKQKTIQGMVNAVKTFKSIYPHLNTKDKKDEIAKHPLHCKTAYDYVVKNYK